MTSLTDRIMERLGDVGDVREVPNEPAPYNGDPREATPIDPDMLALVIAEIGVTGPDAWRLTEFLTKRVEQEQIGTLARRLVRNAQLLKDTDLGAIEILTGVEMLAKERPVRATVLGDLLLEGHNATVVARWKVGKSTLVDNAAKSCVSGGNWLGRFPVSAPMRVALCNYELAEEDMDDRLRAMSMSSAELERLLILNLRGKRMPIEVDAVRLDLAKRLRDHGTQLLIVDPFGAAYAAAGGISENDNAEVRRFVLALDQLKEESGCRTLIMPVHTGRGEQVQGNEQGRGATVLEDWPDVRMLLTKDEDENRFLRTEGRARWNLHESRLAFDDQSRTLMLPTESVGLTRHKARIVEGIRFVVDAVTEDPGINKRALREAITDVIRTNEDKDAAIAAALRERRIHTHSGVKNAVHHYAGPKHEGLDCPEGFR